MGFLLSGQDFHPRQNPRNPFEADVGFAVDLETEFVGAEALRRARDEGVEERLVGFELVERGIPRHGYEIRSAAGDSIGGVTSGTMSPSLEVPIGLGYVPVEHADPGTEFAVVVRGEPKGARVRETPFIER
jgi:aminomethyltransferase